jgi:hypothetical protein
MCLLDSATSAMPWGTLKVLLLWPFNSGNWQLCRRVIGTSLLDSVTRAMLWGTLKVWFGLQIVECISFE